MKIPSFLPAAALVLLACSGSGAPGGDDGGTPPDLLRPPADLNTSGDMTPPPPDLSPPADMTRPPPTVTGLPGDCPASATGQAVYTVFAASCANTAGCHGASSSHFGASNLAQMRAALINVNADQPDAMARVKPSSIDQSYVMYKITGQQTKAVADAITAGGQMPLGRNPLSHDDLCKFVSWIRAGAP